MPATYMSEFAANHKRRPQALSETLCSEQPLHVQPRPVLAASHAEEMSPTQIQTQAAFQTGGQAGGMHDAPPVRKQLPYPSRKAEAIFDEAYKASEEHRRAVCEGMFRWIGLKCGSDLERKFLAAVMFMDVGVGVGYAGPLAMPDSRFIIEPQKQCGDYSIDFAFTLKEGAWFGGMPEIRVAVEIDGAYWHDQDPKRIERDRTRDRYLSMQGWRVLRFSEREVNANAHACAKQVQAFIEAIGQEHVRIDMAQGEAAA